MIDILGVDPSQRHTGLCLLRGSQPTFYEIKTGSEDVLTSSRTIRREFRSIVKEESCQDVALCIERQMVVGGQSSALMFHMQMNFMEAVKQLWTIPDPLFMPLPNQLQSYIYHVHGVHPKEKDSFLVNHFKKTTGYKGRISIHCVDAYYLARLGQDVHRGAWQYKIPSNEPAQIPWRITNGN